MEWVETTGKTIDEAKDAALDRLGIDHDEAEFQVLEEPKAGLFGRVRGEARVRAASPHGCPVPSRSDVSAAAAARSAPRPDERPRRPRRPTARPPRMRRRRRCRGCPGCQPSGAAARRPPASPAPPKATAAAGKGAAGEATSPLAEGPADDGDTAVAPGHGHRRHRGSRRRRPAPRTSRSRGRRPAGAAARTDRSKHADGTTAAATNGSVGATEEGPDVTVTLDEQTALAEQFLSGLLDAFGLEGQLETSRVDESTSEIDITGDDLGLLIGPRGQTIVAIQELTRIVLQRHAEGSYEGRVRVDVSGYRQRRREALARFTEQVADQVRASGTRKALEPMNAADRKVVHDTANELEGVHTVSEGEEPRRWVVIVPND